VLFTKLIMPPQQQLLSAWLQKGGKQHVNGGLFHGDEATIELDAMTRTDRQSTGEGAPVNGATVGLTHGVNGTATHHPTEKLNQPRILCS